MQSEELGVTAPDASTKVEIPSEAAAQTATTPVTAVATATKCSVCNKRPSVKECSMTACTQCCKDEACERHKRLREQASWKERVIAGTTIIQVHAKEKRSKLLKPGRFREPGFVYQGDSVVLWSLRMYMSNPKWRDDALRKSNRRRARTTDAMAVEDVARKISSRRRGNRQRRFRQFFNKKFEMASKK